MSESFLGVLVKTTFVATASLLTAYIAMKAYTQYEESHSKRAVIAKQARSRLAKLPGRTAAQLARIEAHTHNSFEMQILEEIALPNDIHTSFAEVGGLKSLKREIFGSIILPLRSPDLWAQMHQAIKLLSVPAGILFYGPPGTGKTMMARSIAHSARATFINVRPSTWQTKWFGDSQQLVRAVFSVAQLYAPSIIFIDECDAFMKKRGGINDHEATNSMRSEFLALWDGLLGNAQQAGENNSITVLCCTNRPGDIDDAFMRRMPRSFFFPLPDVKEREAILRLLLKDTDLASDVTPASLAHLCADYSGSDLKELCRKTAAIPLNAIIKQHTKSAYNEVMMGAASGSTGPKRKSRKARLLEKDNNKASEAAAAEAAAAASDAQRTPESSEATSSAAPSAAASSSAAAAPSVASSSDHATSLSMLALTKPRPLSLVDFRTSMRSIRPTSGASMRELILFERRHRGTHAMTSADEDSETDDSGIEASEQEEDAEDELYQ